MRPGFFLDVADNSGDGSGYKILPAENYSDIPLGRRPVTFVNSVVRTRYLKSPLELTVGTLRMDCYFSIEKGMYQ